MLKHIYLQVSMKLIEISLKVTIAKFITIFKFSEVISFFLDGIVCKMDEDIVEIAQVKLRTACSYIAVFVEVTFETFIDTSYHCKYTEVKFSAMYE